ncbi:MAG TPA: universal stress protein [Polyangia bacterium]|nr:universal stress protein [Polyangia bacterium]
MSGEHPASEPSSEARSPYRTILVPLDESAIASIVFSTAVGLARMTRATLQLLRVLTLDPVFPPAAHAIPDGLDAKLVADAQAELDGWARRAGDVAFAPPLVVIGDPWRQILALARSVDADLVVLGSHRYHGTDRILGTVAAKVVNHADRDVLVVHRRPAVAPTMQTPVPGR